MKKLKPEHNLILFRILQKEHQLTMKREELLKNIWPNKKELLEKLEIYASRLLEIDHYLYDKVKRYRKKLDAPDEIENEFEHF
jgi:hypothetical protein